MKELLKELEEMCKRVQKEVKDFEFYKTDHQNVLVDLKIQKQNLMSEIASLQSEKKNIKDSFDAEKSVLLAGLSKKAEDLAKAEADFQAREAKLKIAEYDTREKAEQAETARTNYEAKLNEVNSEKLSLEKKLTKYGEFVKTL